MSDKEIRMQIKNLINNANFAADNMFAKDQPTVDDITDAILAIVREARIDELHQLEFYGENDNQALAKLYTHVLLRLRELNKEKKA